MAKGFVKGAWGVVTGTANFFKETYATGGQNVLDAASGIKDLAVAAYNDPSGTAGALLDAGKQGVVNSLVENGSVNGAIGEALGTTLTGFGIGLIGDKGVSKLGSLGRIANVVPDKVVRVVPINAGDIQTLCSPSAIDVFVTAAQDIQGLGASEIAKKLTIPNSGSGFQIFEFATPTGIASPINRTNPGFIGGGRTAGGAREFVIPNQVIPKDANKRIVR